MSAPLSEEYLAEVEAALDAYSEHYPTGFACCSAHGAADATYKLLTEVRRLREVEAGRAAVRPGSRRDLLLTTIRAEGGEWTVGRVKALYAESDCGHVYRATIRADLRTLHRAGYLVQHEISGQRFYTVDTSGGAR